MNTTEVQIIQMNYIPKLDKWAIRILVTPEQMQDLLVDMISCGLNTDQAGREEK